MTGLKYMYRVYLGRERGWGHQFKFMHLNGVSYNVANQYSYGQWYMVAVTYLLITATATLTSAHLSI